ncbi:MAG TPA: hypothetical protein VIG43_02145 [Kurthia sp.]
MSNNKKGSLIKTAIKLAPIVIPIVKKILDQRKVKKQ